MSRESYNALRAASPSNEEKKTQRRVEVTRSIVGIAGMQVCAVNDATDEEILETCNRENPSGTSEGWGTVLRTEREETSLYPGMAWLPVKCDTHPDRIHIIVLC